MKKRIAAIFLILGLVFSAVTTVYADCGYANTAASLLNGGGGSGHTSSRSHVNPHVYDCLN